MEQACAPSLDLFEPIVLIVYHCGYGSLLGGWCWLSLAYPERDIQVGRRRRRQDEGHLPRRGTLPIRWAFQRPDFPAPKGRRLHAGCVFGSDGFEFELQT